MGENMVVLNQVSQPMEDRVFLTDAIWSSLRNLGKACGAFALNAH